SKTSTTGLTEGTYLKLYSCVSGYLATGNLVYQCVESGESYEWQPVSGYSSGTCVPSNCIVTMAVEKSGLSELSYTWYKTDATGSELTTNYYKTNTTTLSEGEYIKLYSCASSYAPTGTLIYQCVKSGTTYEWQPVSGYTNGTCIPTNCTPAKAAEKANLSESSYGWYKTDATGSESTTWYSNTSTGTFSEGEYIKLYSCASGYSLSGTLVYHCENDSSTGIDEWQPVSGYTNGTCVKDE
ncbi:MAG: hypothetical protein IJ853_02035, partial [Rickettsiales bacterium]|nr:hypothetical protein [Rickettsiales bacterium]